MNSRHSPQLGTDLDAASQRQLDRGKAMTELLKQGQFVPMDVIDQCISIFAGTKGFLDDVAIDKVSDFQQNLLEYFNGQANTLRNKLVEAKSFKGIEDEFSQAMTDFKAGWAD